MLRIHWFPMTLRITDLLTVRQHWNSKHVKKRKWIDTVDSSIHPRSYNNFNLIISCRSLKIYYRPIKRANLKIFISADMILKENYPVPFLFVRVVLFYIKLLQLTTHHKFNCAFNETCNGLSYGPKMVSRKKMNQYSIFY